MKEFSDTTKKFVKEAKKLGEEKEKSGTTTKDLSLFLSTCSRILNPNDSLFYYRFTTRKVAVSSFGALHRLFSRINMFL